MNAGWLLVVLGILQLVVARDTLVRCDKPWQNHSKSLTLSRFKVTAHRVGTQGHPPASPGCVQQHLRRKVGLGGASYTSLHGSVWWATPGQTLKAVLIPPPYPVTQVVLGR